MWPLRRQVLYTEGTGRMATILAWTGTGTVYNYLWIGHKCQSLSTLGHSADRHNEGTGRMATILTETGTGTV
jgi:hypothetical protein